MRVGFLVSGRGSNLEAVLDAVRAGSLAGIEPVIAISNRNGVRAIDVARRHGLVVRVLRRADHDNDPTARDTAIGAALRDASVELTLLAGYDQVLQPAFFATYPGRAVNIHPSLLPSHGGRGMHGLAVHESVLRSGETTSGVTIHEVTPELDAGRILAQEPVPVLRDDTAERLAARVLVREHRLLLGLLRAIAGPAADRPLGIPSATMTAASASPMGVRQPQETPHA